MNNEIPLWLEVLNDLNTFLFSSEYDSIKHPFLVLLVISYLSCFISLVISWGIYWKTDINFLGVKEFKTSKIALESIFPVLVNIILFIAKVISFTPISVFFFSVFWVKAYLQFVGNQKKDSDDLLAKYNHKANSTDNK